MNKPVKSTQGGRRPPPVETRWKPGQSGNPNGRPPKAVSIVSWLKEYADLVVPSDKRKRTRAQVLADAIWMAALRGDKDARKMIVEHIDGRPVERQEHAGPGGGPIQSENVIVIRVG